MNNESEPEQGQGFTSQDESEPGEINPAPTEKAKGHTFDDLIETLPEDEQQTAQYHLEIKNRYMQAASHNYRLLDSLPNFINGLKARKGEKETRCKLLHLYIGSGMDAAGWEELPMDTPDHDFEHYVSEELIPQIEEGGF